MPETPFWGFKTYFFTKMMPSWKQMWSNNVSRNLFSALHSKFSLTIRTWTFSLKLYYGSALVDLNLFKWCQIIRQLYNSKYKLPKMKINKALHFAKVGPSFNFRCGLFGYSYSAYHTTYTGNLKKSCNIFRKETK